MSDSDHSVQSVFLTAEWRHLLMLNYPVEASLLNDFIPRGTALDSWNGSAMISLVGFRFLNTRVKGIPIPFHRDFEEINLRFYVRRKAPEGWRRGVVFIKEVVPRRAIAVVARVVYGENYVACETDSNIVEPHGDRSGLVSYRWKSKGDQFFMIGATDGAPTPLAPNSEERFIAEHYWGYSKTRGERTMEYRVEHVPWNVGTATGASFEGNAVSFYGPGLGEVLRESPTSAFVADGSAIIVREGVMLPEESHA